MTYKNRDAKWNEETQSGTYSDKVHWGELKIKPKAMRVLHLTLNKKWFDMIASGEKKEEYRAITEYWQVRLMNYDIVSRNSYTSFRKYNGFRSYDVVCFRNGYKSDAPMVTVKFEGISNGEGKRSWGAEPGKEYFVIKLGEIIK